MRKTTYSMMRLIFHDARAEIAKRARTTFGHVKVIWATRSRLSPPSRRDKDFRAIDLLKI
jgi:hypothetical protein